MGIAEIKRQLQQWADPRQADVLQRFFKTGPGQYGEGDRFLGIKMPRLRQLARTHRQIPLDQVAGLLQSPLHEERMTALLILTYQFPRATESVQAGIYAFYLAHTRWINNWDLVDITAPHIVGAFLAGRDKMPLRGLARSASLWERRIAIVATHHFIRQGHFADTLAIAGMLLEDPHDLIHKAAGWMLREVGKRNMPVLEHFLKECYAGMPRTMLRYAIEHLPEARRQAYLQGGI